MPAPVLPPIGPDLSQWGRQLSSYLSRQLPRLFTKTADDNASENGILLWDQVDGYPTVSKNGEWRQVVLADGYAFLGQDADITAAAVNTAYAITYDTPAMSSGITLGTPASRITFAEGGTYILAFSAQVTSTSASTVSFRFCTIVTNLHQNNATNVVSRTAIFSVSAGDYLEVMWAVDSTAGYLHATAATAYAPSAPSTSLSITRIRA